MAEKKKAARKRKAVKPKRKPRGKAKQEKAAKKRAKDAEAVTREMAEANPPESPETRSGNSAQILARNQEIWRAKLRGLSISTLAQIYDLSETTIRGVLADKRREGTRIADLKADEAIEDHIWGLDAVIDELAGVAAKEKGSARVSAIKARADTMESRFRVLQEVGILPRDLGTMNLRINIDQMTREAIRVLQANEVDAKVMIELMMAWDPAGYAKWREEQAKEGRDITNLPALPAST